ncbi:MAG: MFS transporter, partial [Chloroflexota bacterium]
APADAREEKVGFKDLWRFFRRPGIGHWVLILVTYGLAISIAYALINPLLVDLGWTLDRIGFATNIVGSIFAIIGAMLAGTLVQWIGRKSAMLLTGLFAALSVAGLYIPAQGVNNIALVYVSLSVMLLAYGASTTILATLTMDKSDPSTAGTDYSLQYSLFSLLSFTFSGLALGFAESVGYANVLTAAIVIGLASLVVVWFYNDFDPAFNESTTNNMSSNDGLILAEG